MAVSPFSLEHNNWTVYWKRLPSNMKDRPILGQVAENEKEALKAIASIGLITVNQLFHLYSLNKNKLTKMVQRNRIVQHEIIMNNSISIVIYSLGVNGAKIIGVPGFENNYWVRYTIRDILQRLLFFNFYERFNTNELLPAPAPFIGSILINNKPMYVYVARGDMDDLFMFLKWNTLGERLIIITEKLSFLEQLKPYLLNIKHRVILDNCIVDKKPLNESFYFLENNEFIKENE